MPEDQDKKISYKILTAESFLTEETSKKQPEEIKEKSETVNVQKVEAPKEEIFYIPKEEKELPFKQKQEPLKKETPKQPSRGFKLPPSLFKFLLFGTGIFLIFILILFLKPQEKFKAIFKSKEEQKEVIKPSTQTPAVILFPTTTLTSTPTTTNTSTMTTTIITTTTTTTTTSTTTTITQEQKIPLQSFQEIPFLENFSLQEIDLENLDFSAWQKELEKFLSRQEFSGTKINLNFLYHKNKVPYDFLFDYFLKPTKISSDEIKNFKDSLTGNYGFLLYYGHTRKYPILIFEIKDKNQVEKFNQKWEKLTMKEDLKTLFLGFEPPKTKNNFVTRKQGDYSYRILDFGNNFKIIWTIADNYLIYASTEIGVKEILSFLK
jgi:hypothetical protein